MQSKTRGNLSIWRVAEWIDRRIENLDQKGLPKDNLYRCDKDYQNDLYDKAAELMKKIALNEFTGDDNHGD